MTTKFEITTKPCPLIKVGMYPYIICSKMSLNEDGAHKIVVDTTNLNDVMITGELPEKVIERIANRVQAKMQAQFDKIFATEKQMTAKEAN